MATDKNKVLDDLGKWLIDVAKYTATAILISSWFSQINTWGVVKNILAIAVVIVTLLVGLLIKNRRK